MLISFDFDGTLDDDFYGELNSQKVEIQNLAKKYVEFGHKVCIITKRFGPDFKPEQNEHQKVFELANSLGIKEIYFTNREMKFQKIIELKIEIHFENSDYEIELIEKWCHEKNHRCLVVSVEDKNWKSLVFNDCL